MRSKLTKLLNIKHPIIQAPMAGGVTTSKLIAEVSNAGALGMIGAGYMTALQLREQIKEIRTYETAVFGVNVFVPNQFSINPEQLKRAKELLSPYRKEVNLDPEANIEIPKLKEIEANYREQLNVVMEEDIRICSFTFGIPSKEIVKELKEKNIILIGTATTVKEAIEIEKSGMDIVVVQGSEAGGHRGNFLDDTQRSLIGLMSLIPQVADKVSIPIIAAGGIMDGRGLMASLSLGAQGVQMGTAFLTCIESGAKALHKEAIIHATEEETIVTRAFSGKFARGVQNRFISELKGVEKLFPDFPIQNTLTKELRGISASQNNPDFMSLWSGQSPRLAKKQTVEYLIENMLQQARKIEMNLFFGKREN